MLIVFLRTLILYALVVVGMRLMGKRQLGELQPSELVITLLISNIATLPIENTDAPLLAGAVPILTLMCSEVLLSSLCVCFAPLRTLIGGSPRVIIRNGNVDQNELKALRYSMEDLLEQLRCQSVFDIEEVDMAVVETTGQLSICKKSQLQAATVQDLGIKKAPADLPVLVVNAGQVVPQGLAFCQLSEAELLDMIQQQGQELSNLFFMTCTPKRQILLVPMDGKHMKKQKQGKSRKKGRVS